MRNEEGFNLSNAIRKWKKNFSDNYSITPDNIEELESHLLDEIDHLKLKGLGEEEAFLMATKQIGTKEFLVSEYGKVNVFNTIIEKCMPVLQCLLFYVIYRSSIMLSGDCSNIMIGLFNLDFVETHVIFANILSVAFFLGLLMAIYSINNTTKKGKSGLRLMDNIPLLIVGFILLMWADNSYYMLLTKGMSINEYWVSVCQNDFFKQSSIAVISMMTLGIYLKWEKARKKKMA